MIDRLPKFIQNFDDYQMVQLPADIQNIAVMLTSTRKQPIPGDYRLPLNLSEPLDEIFVFQSGTIVFWGVPSELQRSFLERLSPLAVAPQPSYLVQEEKEFLRYVLVDSNDRSKLIRDCLEIPARRQADSLRLDKFACSHVVALSVKLGIWELDLDRYIESVGWVTEQMKSGQDLKLTRDQVFRKTGEIYHLKHRINLSSDLLDLPDVYWDRHEQEVLYLSLVSFLNLKRRTAVMNEKLNNCCELMNLLATHMNDKHHTRLEWMIIALILVEVLFELSSFVLK